MYYKAKKEKDTKCKTNKQKSLSLFTDNLHKLFAKIKKEKEKNMRKATRSKNYSKVMGLKADTQKSIVFSYTSNKKMKFKNYHLPQHQKVKYMGDFPSGTMVKTPCSPPVLTAALFTIARSWTQSKCPSTDEWIKKMWYIYTMEYYSAIKRNETGSFVESWLDLETVIQSEVSQKEKSKYRILTHICGI